MTLNKKCEFLSLLFPHLRWEVRLGIYNFIISHVDIQACFLHLSAELSHHDGGLGLILVGLDHALVLFWVVVSWLISLGECMMISLASAIISKTAQVCFLFACLLNFNRHYFNLYSIVISITYLFISVRQYQFNINSNCGELTWLSASLISTSNMLGMTNSSVSIESK